MSTSKLSALHIFLTFSFFLISGKTEGQLAGINYAATEDNFIDTTDYIPFFYEGALDYNLMIAASEGYSSEIERLIRKGADVNAETIEGASPLIFAVTYNRLEAVNTLLTYNPLLDKLTSNYETPLLIAVKNRNFEITEVLIRAGADIDYTDRYGATPLNHASLYGYTEIVDLLLYYDASVELKSAKGTSPLLASISAGYADVAEILIRNGANMESRDNDGFTPFLMASFKGDTLIMNILYKKGVDIYATNKSNYNALTLAILADRSEAAEFLLRKGDKWTGSGPDEVDPYNVASKYRRKNMVDLLKRNNVPGHLRYGFDQVSISASSRFFVNDFYSGLSLSLKEPYLNGGIIAGCDVKLWYTKVLVKESEHLFYQYLEKGAVAYAGLFKDFALTDRIDRSNLAFSTALLTGYSFGNKQKGTLIAPGNKLKVIPAISLKLEKKDLSITLGMEYVKTEFYNTGPIWIRAGISYNLFFDNVRTQIKPIKWQ
jgi:ankyrin repeat protein